MCGWLGHRQGNLTPRVCEPQASAWFGDKFCPQEDTRGKEFLSRDCAQKWVPPGAWRFCATLKSRPAGSPADGIAVQDRTGGSQWNRLSWMALTARSASSRSMMQEILISLVEIIWMLMLLLASASNMLAATPLWLCIPAPTMDTLA